jgi:probable rRNA maturation factor
MVYLFFETNFILHNEDYIISIINRILCLEKVLLGDINLIFCNDKYLLFINNIYLYKNYYTDVITFNRVEKNIISGDIFISIERVKDNSINIINNFISELTRVIVHSLFHLIGYNEKKIFSIKEDFFIHFIK